MANCMECVHSNVCRALDNGDDYIKEDCTEYLEFLPVVERSHSVAYLCKEHGEGNTCPRDGSTCSYDMCKHTTDVKYAKNFVQIDDDKYAEIDEQKRWTRCEENLPDKSDWYWVTVLNEINGLYETEDMYFDSDSQAWKFHPYSKVIAWMPIPEPYKKEGEQK